MIYKFTKYKSDSEIISVTHKMYYSKISWLKYIVYYYDKQQYHLVKKVGTRELL